MLLDLTELSSYLPLVSCFEFGNVSGKLFPCTEGRVRTIMVPPGTPRAGAFSPIYLEMSAGYYYLLGAQCSCVVCDTLRASPICLSGRRVLYLFSCAHGNPLSLSQWSLSVRSLFSYTNRV